MRKLRVFESISIDGYFADAQGSMNWAKVGFDDPEFASWVGGNASAGAELLFGRKTYQMMESFWQSDTAMQESPQVVGGMNAAKKHVATRTLEPRWTNSHRLQGDLLEAVRALKASSGSNITILGRGDLTAQLGAAGLIDEYQFVVVPIALGAGRTVFTRGVTLKLIEQRAFRCGNVVLTYAKAAA